MNADVLIHRWFEGGANWAYAPRLQSNLIDLVTALSGKLKSSDRGTFQLQVDGRGWLVGDICDDLASPDPKAASRHPTILRAVLVPRHVTIEEARKLVEQLNSFLPDQPGRNSSLTVSLPDVSNVRDRAPLPPPAQPAMPRHNSMKIIIPALSLLILGVIAVVAWQKLAPTRPAREQVSTIASEMKRQLEGWTGRRAEESPDAVINAYFEFLSQSHLGKALGQSKHPYVAFVKRLPVESARPSSTFWSDSEVTLALTALAARLDPNGSEGVKHDAQSDLKGIDVGMSYDAWRKKDPHKQERKSGVFNEAPGDLIYSYVERFRDPSRFQGIADKMAELLDKWQLKHGKSPFEVLRVFFTTLQRPSWLDACTAEDKQHPYWHFADRLPHADAINGSFGWTCDDQDGVEEALELLLRKGRFGVDPTGKDAAGRIDAIKRKMFYDDWPEAQDSTTEPEKKELIEFVRPFRGAKKGG